MLRLVHNFAPKYSTNQSLPLLERLGIEVIHSNLTQKKPTLRLYNNILIGANYLSLAGKYSKCYLCKLPGAKIAIRRINNMELIDSHVSQMKPLIFGHLPDQLRLLKWIAGVFKYQNRNMYSSIALIFSSTVREENKSHALKFMAAIQSITLGFELHNAIQTNYKPNTLVNVGLKFLQKVIKDKYLVLAGDYFHIRGSVLAGQTKNIETSRIMAQMEVNLCKYVHAKECLKRKIAKEGYDKISVEEIYELNLMKIRQTVESIKGMEQITGQRLQQTLEIEPSQKQQLLQSLGLLVLYRKELQNFMFNFYKIVNKFFEYKRHKNIFCDQFTLSHYLFLQSAQKTTIRIDLAYLNTVQMMSEEIKLIQRKIKDILGEQSYKILDNKLRYILSMYL